MLFGLAPLGSGFHPRANQLWPEEKDEMVRNVVSSCCYSSGIVDPQAQVLAYVVPKENGAAEEAVIGG